MGFNFVVTIAPVVLNHIQLVKKIAVGTVPSEQPLKTAKFDFPK